MESAIWISLGLVLVTSALLVFTGLKKQPGSGVIAALVIIGLALWLRGRGLDSLGLRSPGNWWVTICLGLALGVILQLVTVVLIEPLSEKLTRSKHDHSVVANVKGNWKALLKWIVMVWLLVAFLEEGVYRGFLMTEIAWLAGTNTAAMTFNVVFTSLVFGLSHGYQNRCGMLSTGIVGAMLGLIFIWSDFNLWLPIFVHGFIDTIGIALIAVDGDAAIRRWVWRQKQGRGDKG
jgi:membrane protease YdiL (CAAX protease family)